MAKVMDKYAKLLGHQNHKQKIQYINRMKEEYMQCRKEKEELKVKVNKQSATIQRLEKEMKALEGKKKFDPKQAFSKASSKKEPPRSPLKDGQYTGGVALDMI
nr:hypothetical protein BaRGS_031245 [Batillaria attramentaria]